MRKRLTKELNDLKNNPVDNAEVIQEVDNFQKLKVILQGPKGSKYENKTFEISVEIADEYPVKPPKIKFITPIDIPFSEKNGYILIYSLFGEDWNPFILIRQCIERIAFFMSPVETRIDTFTINKIRYEFQRNSIKDLIDGALGHSLNENKELSFIGSNVPVLYGFYIAHANHCPIRIKPDDIWLLIIQGFINHMNLKSEVLRDCFVNFSGKKQLQVEYNIDQTAIDKKTLEDFSQQMVNQIESYVGKEIIEILSPNFTTTTHDSEIICKISIMGAFKKYFDYSMNVCGCGVPYVVLEGTADDYRKIIEKAKKLSAYKFNWYIDRIIPHIEKMVEAKEGKVDKEYFQNMIQKKELMDVKLGPSGHKEGEYQAQALSGWFLHFFSHIESKDGIEIYEFKEESLKIKDFQRLTNQMIEVPFNVHNIMTSKDYKMKFKVGFVGCDKNEKNEVFPVQGWLASYQ